MTLHLIADRVVNGKIYPALAQTQEGDFDHCWPYTVPLRLQEYCIKHSVELNIISILSGRLMHFILWAWVSLILASITLN